MMWWWNGYWPMHVFGPLMMLLFFVLCGTMMFFMMRGMMGTGGKADSRYTLDILKQRFARGEISQAQYEEQRRVLEA